MTKYVIPESREKSYQDQQALIAQYTHYEIPEALDATTCVFTHYIRSGQRYLNAPECDGTSWSYTVCQEKVQGEQVIVGGFTNKGLDVLMHSTSAESVGVAALRRIL